MNNFCFILFFVVGLMACARPNYQDIPAVSVEDQGQAKSSSSLQLPTSSVCIQLQWQVLPTEKDMGSFVLRFYREGAIETALTPANGSVAVELWMPSMGHGSSPVKIEKKADNTYRVFNVYFIMPGEWDIRIQIKDGKNIVEQVVQKITI